MNTISLEARKRLIAEGLIDVEDASILTKIENILKKATPKRVIPMTPEELRKRVQRGIEAVDSGDVMTTEEVRKSLGL